ncbi:MAG: F420-dependent oxidoreductase-like protein [Verrucomicrobiales bacterium]|jgi:F420-dependent oxidoreductase-like protein
MRFGTMVPQGWKHDLADIPNDKQWDHILETAQQIEADGWDSLWVYDHFHTHPKVTQESVFDAWVLMAAIAAVTSRVRIGQMCTCVLYRPPALLAKMAASIDAISKGRLDVGIGAGWSDKEFAAYGYDYPSNKVRLDMLNEAAQVLKTMWTTKEAHFEGEHYRVRGAITRPLPQQSPHPPLWIAGGGEKRTLRIVAEHGDMSNFGKSVPQFIHKSEVLASHCEAIGRDFGEIGRTVHLMSVVGRDQADVDAKLEVAARRRNASAEEFAAEHLVGTVEQVSDTVGQYAAAGCAELILYFYDMGVHDSQELFASEIAPQHRS